MKEKRKHRIEVVSRGGGDKLKKNRRTKRRRKGRKVEEKQHNIKENRGEGGP